MRLRIVLVACAALALSVGAATAAAGDGHGNSGAAKKCQKGGDQNWVREDGSSFENTGDCVSYAAQGGSLIPAAYKEAAAYCSAIGGVFGMDDQVPFGSGFLWSCNGWGYQDPGDFDSKFDELLSLCGNEGGNKLAVRAHDSTAVASCGGGPQ